MHKIFANTLFIGKQFISLPSCHSTNDIALDMAADNLLYDGAVIHAEAQTKGRGQRGNQWLTESGKNLTFSLFIQPKFLYATKQFDLNRIISVATLEIVEMLINSKDVAVKWPNDIYIGDEKIAGILIENTISGTGISKSIIGIGLNVNQTDNLPFNATSLLLASGKPFDIMHVLDLLAARIEKYYLALKQQAMADVYDKYSKHLYQKDLLADYKDKDGLFKGFIRRVELDGTLLIENENEQLKRYQFKEVQFL